MAYTVFTNGKFFTTEDANQKRANFEKCMIVKDGLIEFVGNDDGSEVSTAKSNGATVQDLNGRTVLPGFIDGHIHLLMMGQSLQKVNLEKCKNLEDIRATIRAYAQTHPNVPRILCRAWMHSMTDGRAECAMLDDVDPRPIYIDSKDLHSSWCNTAAIAELGVEALPDPVGGTIHRDESGRPTGLLSEAACVSIVWPHLAKMTSQENRVAALRAAISELNGAGYTGCVDMAMDEIGWEGLLALRDKEGGRLPMRIAAHWLITPTDSAAANLAQVDRAVQLNQQFNASSSPDLRIAGIKVICDGVVDACTAALLEPYAVSPSTAPPAPLWTASQLDPVVRAADAAGLQVALHAIGDAAVQLALDALERHGTPAARHRIEHLELTRPGDGARLARAGITASVQPVHADPAIIRRWPALLGPARCGRAFAYREFADAGAQLALGTDAPTAPWLPLRNVYVAVTRRSARESECPEVVGAEFALELCDAVAAATQGAAFACRAEERVGRLSVGLRADFVVVDMQWEAESLLRARLCETWFEGRRVFDGRD